MKNTKKVIINEIMCNDTDLLGWYAQLESKELNVTSIDVNSGLIYVENCPFAIHIDDAIVL